MRRSKRLIAVLLVAGAVGFGATAAYGTTGSSTAGNLSFSVTTADTATRGQLMTYSGSLTNNASVAAPVKLTFTVAGPSITRTASYYVTLAANATLNKSGSYFVPSRAPAGSYTVTMTVTSGNSSGQAQAQTTVS
jgi:hypothetical protein